MPINGQESLKEFIRIENSNLLNEINNRHSELDNKIDGSHKELVNKIDGSHKELDSKIDNVRNDIKLLIAEMNKDISGKIGGLEVRMVTSQKDMLIKIFGIIVGTVGIAVTILKLFP